MSRVLALVMAGGEGSRMDLLTRHRAKPTLPYGGVYRLIDFPLTNCMHSGISDVWILQQYQPHSLNEHIANGRPWDLDRTHGGLRVLHPHTGTQESGWQRGNADAIYRNKTFIKDFRPDVIVMLSSDHVYKLDYRKLLAQHERSGAGATLVTTRVPSEEAPRFGTVTLDGDRVTDFEYKVEQPSSDIATTEVFAFDPRVLLGALEDIAGSAEEDDPELQDFGHELIPRLVADGCVRSYGFDGYWRDVGTISSYWKANLDLLKPSPPIALDDPEWPIHSLRGSLPPALVREGAVVGTAYISPGCDVRGEVQASILGPGAKVAEGARVHGSLLLGPCEIGPGAEVTGTIVDVGARVAEGARVGAAAGSDSPQDDDITILGRSVVVEAGTRVQRGERVGDDEDERVS